MIKTPREYTDDEKEAIRKIKYVLTSLCNNEKYKEYEDFVWILERNGFKVKKITVVKHEVSYE